MLDFKHMRIKPRTSGLSNRDYTESEQVPIINMEILLFYWNALMLRYFAINEHYSENAITQ